MILIRRAGLLGATFALACLAACGGGSGGGSGSGSRNAYVAVPQANAIAAFRVNSSGDLTRVLGSPFAGGTSPVAIAVHPSGKFVYAANQGGNDVSLFTINSNTGELTEVMPRTAAGLNPSSLVMDSGGDLLFVTNETANTISVYSVSSSDGTLTEIAGSPFPTGARPVALASVAFRQIPVCSQRNSAAGIRLFRGCGQPGASSEFAFFGRQWTEFPGGGSLGALSLRNQLQ